MKRSFVMGLILTLVPMARADLRDPAARPLQADIRNQSKKLRSIHRSLQIKHREMELLDREQIAQRQHLAEALHDLLKTRRALEQMKRHLQEKKVAYHYGDREMTRLQQITNNTHAMLSKGLVQYYTGLKSSTLPPQMGVVLVETARSLKSTRVQYRQMILEQERLVQEQEKLELLCNRLRHQAREKKRLSADRETHLRATVDRRRQTEQERAQLEQNAQALQKLLSRLGREQQKKMAAMSRSRLRGMSQAMDARKGAFPWPIAGHVVAPFGKHYSHALNRIVVSNGIQLQGRSGSSVTAIDRGTVLFAGEFRSYGRMVIVGHPGGFHSIYGSLGQINVKEGDAVLAQAPIGQMSDQRAEAVFYFELRREGRAVNPMPWLLPPGQLDQARLPDRSVEGGVKE